MVQNKNILIVEDIVDTGRTLTNFIAKCEEFGVADVKIFSLCNKPCRRVEIAKDLEVHFCGFVIPDYFIIGYGLDYN